MQLLILEGHSYAPADSGNADIIEKLERNSSMVELSGHYPCLRTAIIGEPVE
jgi:hypothetical protein